MSFYEEKMSEGFVFLCREDEEEKKDIQPSYERFDKFEKDEDKKLKKNNNSPVQKCKILTTGEPQETAVRNNQEDLLDILKNILKEWLENTSFDKSSTGETMTDSDTASEDVTTSFQLRAVNFLSKNPEWANETEISEQFKEKMKIKNAEKVSSSGIFYNAIFD